LLFVIFAVPAKFLDAKGYGVELGLGDIEYNMLKANSLLPETETGDPE
jgi:hypothetical protein